jgi:hypothetical protein
MRGLCREQPAVSFSTVTIANTTPTEFTRDFDPVIAGSMEKLWRAAGSFGYDPMPLADVAEQLADLLAAPMVVESITLVGPAASPA